MEWLAWVALSYAVGTIPSPYLIALAGRRRDVIERMRRPESQGDAHFVVATHMSRALGVVSMVLDMAKGAAPTLAAIAAERPEWVVAGAGAAAVAGHCFPPYARRSGGRGLTTAAGAALIAVPWAMVATGLISLVGTVTRRGGLGTSVGFGLLPAFAWAFGYPGASVAMSGGIVVLIWVRRLEGFGADRARGVPAGRAVIGRLLYDLPGGRRR